MGFIETFLGKSSTESVSCEDVNVFINEKIEENIHLDYTQMSTTEEPNYNEIAKSVSAFLNSDGGFLVLGVSEQKLKEKTGKVINVRIFPSEITWGPSTLTREKLEHAIRAKIQPWHNDIIIIPIRNPNQETQSVFLIDVPKSKIGPHMANYRFHIRSNFEIKPMEYWQIAEMFKSNWIQKSELVTYVYGPLYNEIDSFLSRRKFTKANVVRFSQIVYNHKYLLDQVNSDLRKKTERFYSLLDEFNRRLDNASAIINSIINKVASEYFKVPTGEATMHIMIQTNSGCLGPSIADILLQRTTPEEYILQDRPGDTIVSKAYELESAGQRTSISEKGFYECLSKCQNVVNADPNIKWIWTTEETLSDLGNDLRKRIMELLS
jgi:hypothetical protein